MIKYRKVRLKHAVLAIGLSKQPHTSCTNIIRSPNFDCTILRRAVNEVLPGPSDARDALQVPRQGDHALASHHVPNLYGCILNKTTKNALNSGHWERNLD